MPNYNIQERTLLMNTNITDPELRDVDQQEENVAAGIVGAFLFALAGGVLYFLLDLIGFVASLSGFVGIICAIKGYSIFAKKESTKGVVIAIVMTVLVLVVAWYFGLSYDVYERYQYWYEIGEVDFTLTFAESVRCAYLFLGDLEVAVAYLLNLGLGLLFAAMGAYSSVKVALRRAKAQRLAEEMPAEEFTAADEIDFSQTEESSEESDTENKDAE